MKKRKKGMTFVEMVISLFVVSVLSMAAYPIAEHSMRRSKEVELRQNLRAMRKAIDAYYKNTAGKYPKDFETLVECRLLRSVPVDPFTGRQDWLTLSTTDEVDNVLRTETSDGHDLFDVRSRSRGGPPNDATPYRMW